MYFTELTFVIDIGNCLPFCSADAFCHAAGWPVVAPDHRPSGTYGLATLRHEHDGAFHVHGGFS